jgi:hypothetical protein
MSGRFPAALLAALLLIGTHAGAADGIDDGKRPPRQVFDPAGLLEPQAMREISGPLVRIFENEDIDVIVVVLTQIGDAPPGHVAKRLAAGWCASPLHAVVLHVPGHAESPWIAPGGRMIGAIQPDAVRDAVAQARRNASREPGDAAKVRAAAIETADMLRYWRANVIRRNEAIDAERIKIRLELETKARQQRVVMLTAAASVIPIAAGFALVFHLRRRLP